MNMYRTRGGPRVILKRGVRVSSRGEEVGESMYVDVPLEQMDVPPGCSTKLQAQEIGRKLLQEMRKPKTRHYHLGVQNFVCPVSDILPDSSAPKCTIPCSCSGLLDLCPHPEEHGDPAHGLGLPGDEEVPGREQPGLQIQENGTSLRWKPQRSEGSSRGKRNRFDE